MLFFYPKEEIVAGNKVSSCFFESFTPTFDGDQGWLLYYTYRTYDSFGPQPEVYYEVVDLYEHREMACEVAKKMRDHHTKEFDGRKNDGSKIYDQWNHQKVSLEDIYVLRVEVKNTFEVQKEVF